MTDSESWMRSGIEALRSGESRVVMARLLDALVAEHRTALAKAEQERDEAAAQTEEHAKSARRAWDAAHVAEQERDAAVADNAALVKELRQVHRWANKTHQKDLAAEIAQLLAQPRPGASLLEKHRKELERLSAALADMLRTAENWGHGPDCSGDDDDEQNANCECGKAEILAVLSPPDGSLPGAAFLSRRDALAKELRGAKRALVRARNEGLERARTALADRLRGARAMLNEVEASDLHTKWAGIAEALDEAQVAVAALKEPEE